jgi:hypothetical protein
LPGLHRIDTLKVREDNIVSISASPLPAVSGPAGSLLLPAAAHPVTSPATTNASRVVLTDLSLGIRPSPTLPFCGFGPVSAGRPFHFIPISRPFKPSLCRDGLAHAEGRPSIYFLNIQAIR